MTRRPRVGEVLTYVDPHGRAQTERFTVTKVDGEICYTRSEHGNGSMFIWRFRAGQPDEHLNAMFHESEE